MRRRYPVAQSGRHVRCTVCRAYFDQRTAMVRLDGGHLCPGCQDLANLLTGTVAREAALRARLEP